jgi:hypothetical protein
MARLHALTASLSGCAGLIRSTARPPYGEKVLLRRYNNYFLEGFPKEEMAWKMINF